MKQLNEVAFSLEILSYSQKYSSKGILAGAKNTADAERFYSFMTTFEPKGIQKSLSYQQLIAPIQHYYAVL